MSDIAKRTRQYRDWEPIRKWLLEQVNALTYQPSLRWCFYRVMEPFGLKKSDYSKFDSAISRARKQKMDGWLPDTLADESREVIDHLLVRELFGARDYDNFEMRANGEIRQLFSNITTPIWHSEIGFYAEVWFEAKAMTGQFEHFIPREFTLRPFGGDYSIPKKYEAAMRIREMADKGRRQVIILYFGDCDKKGFMIPKSAVKDIRNWAMADFDFKQVGLTESQVQKFQLPENPERPGQYQWEALSDAQAQEVIEKGLSLLPLDELKQTKQQAETKRLRWLKKYLRQHPEIARIREAEDEDGKD